MTRAILISGNALRFHEEVNALKLYLLSRVDIGPTALLQFHGCFVQGRTVLARITEAVTQKSAYPVIIQFTGHGHEHGWWLDDARSLTYFDLADALKDAMRQVVVVNDCSHAMAAAGHFERLVSPEKVSLIGAAEKGEKRDPYLGAWLRRNWGKRRSNRLSPALHWGADLDHHFYPSDLPEG